MPENEIVSNIAVNQEQMEGAVVAEEDQDALDDMLGYLKGGLEGETAIEGDTEAGIDEEVVEPEPNTAIEGDAEVGLEDETEAVSKQAQEAAVEPEAPKNNLPSYLDGIEIKKDTVIIGEVELDKNLVIEAVNGREGKGKADWLKQPVSSMDEDKSLVYKTIQSLSDKAKTQASEQEQIDTGEKTYTAEQWEAYNDLKKNSPTFRQVISDIDKQHAGVPTEKPQESVTEKANISEALAETLATGIEEGMDKKEISTILEKYVSDIASETKTQVKSMVRETMSAQQVEDESMMYDNKIKAEHEELMDEDDRYVKICEDIGKDGAHPIARLVFLGNPNTGEAMTPRQAFKYLLGNQTSNGAAYSFELDAIPEQTTVQLDQSALTTEEMDSMSDSEAMIAQLKKSGF